MTMSILVVYVLFEDYKRNSLDAMAKSTNDGLIIFSTFSFLKLENSDKISILHYNHKNWIYDISFYL